MSSTLSIQALVAHGACARECALLKQIYPSGTIIFDMSFYPQMRDRQINVLWASTLLAPSVLTQVVLSWYDRATNNQTPTWKSDLRTLVAQPQAVSSSDQLTARLTDRRTADATNELSVALAGVGYAASAYAVKFSEAPPDEKRKQSAVVVLSQWCARSAAAIENVAVAGVLDDLKSSVFQALSQHGVAS